jgi:hypothetical protein
MSCIFINVKNSLKSIETSIYNIVQIKLAFALFSIHVILILLDKRRLMIIEWI